MISPSDNQKTILVHAPNWVGDHAMAFSFYRALDEFFTGYEKILIGRKWVADLLPPGVFNHLITLEGKHLSINDLDYLKEHRAEYAFTLSPSFRSALLLRQSTALYRIGYRSDFRSLLLKYPAQKGAKRIPPFNKSEHRSLSYLRLLTPFMPGNLTAEDFYCRLKNIPVEFKFSQSETRHLREIERSNRLLKKKYWVICPGSVAPSKIYPVKHLISLIRNLLGHNSISIALVGSQIEKPYAAEILQALSEKEKRKTADLTGQTSLHELMHILRNARGVIANDSGVAHLTSLTLTPLVTFQGMGRKEETVPLNSEKTVLQRHLKCSPCMKKECPRRDYPLECLDTIEPHEVMAAMRSLDSSLLFNL